ncbi:M6 family metalloprotease domain-containing protein [Brevibacillus sp. H7]|uniref:M6 family metalloprotease domain-containing protein n=1 Tax=Brevibacillus sp. H7 TaxID=3349138 RepID=UPI00382A92FF
MKKGLMYVLFTALSIFFSSSIVSAAPAAPHPMEYQQPSGETFTATLHGDEWFNWVTAETGEVIVKGDDHFWYYAITRGDELKASNSRYLIHKKPQKTITNRDVTKIARQPTSKSRIKAKAIDPRFNMKHSQYINLGSNLLVLLVQFADTKIKYTDAQWNQQTFGSTGKSVRKYYEEVSNETYTLRPAQENYGTANDGIIKVTLPYTHPNTAGNSSDMNGVIVSDALYAANKYIDLSKFDQNKDRKVTSDELHLMTIVAGYEASYGAKSPSVWGHQYWIKEMVLDDVSLGNQGYISYTQFGELHGSSQYNDDHMATIGIIAHEFGHELGLPDLYDTDHSSMGVGPHSLMADNWSLLPNEYAGATPPHLDPWSKWVRLP